MISLISLCLILSASVLEVYCQYEQPGRYYTPAPVAILMHKQALAHDGSFNYAFSAENGLQQGEKINPDGSRTGAYSYVDPNGKTVTLKYTAGKDGFRVLEGDHVPRPPPVPAQPQPQPVYYQPAQSQPHHLEPAYRPNTYESAFRSASNYRPPVVAYTRPQYSVGEGHQYRASSNQQYSSSADEEPHKGPHSFGSGYAFEFSG